MNLIIDPLELRRRQRDVLLLDLRPGEDYAVGHLEGAKPLDLYGVSLNDSSEAPLNAFLAMFKVLFGSRGVTLERPVVVYDHESGERAARALWLLKVLGHPDARLLDGGTHAWMSAGLPLVRLEQAPPPVDPAKAPPTAPPFRGEISLDAVATRADILAGLDRDDVVVVDVRRESEYRGTEKRARRAGTIPGAVHVFWREHLDAHGRFRPSDDIRRLYESRGVTPDKTVIALCHGGYRSASTWIALKTLGYPRVKNYIAAWGEWGNREDTPIVVPPA